MVLVELLLTELDGFGEDLKSNLLIGSQLKSSSETETGSLVVAGTLCLVCLPASLLAVVLGLSLPPDPQVFKSTNRVGQYDTPDI